MENILTIVKKSIIYLKNKFVYYLSLSTPDSRLSVIFFCLLVLILLPSEKLYLLPVFSVYDKLGLYVFFGFEFYSAGMTRALSALSHLRFVDAYNYNPLVFIFILVLFVIIIKDILAIKNKS